MKPKKIVVFSFFFGFLKNILVELIGLLPLNEIFAIIFLFSKTYRNKLITIYRSLYSFLFCIVLLLFGAISSDIYNDSSFKNWSRGIANIGIIIPIVGFLWINLKRSKSALYAVLIGYSISLICFVWFSPLYGNLSNSLSRLLIAPLLENCLIVISYYIFYTRLQNIFWIISIIAGFSLLFLLDSRAEGLIFIASGLLYQFLKIRNVKTTTKSLLLKFSFTILLIFIIGYGFILSSTLKINPLSERTSSQIEKIEYKIDPFQIIKIGRTWTYLSPSIIAEKPIMGYGSWPKDIDGKFYNSYISINKFDQLTTSRLKSRKVKPLHSNSVLLGSWLNYGILGFIATLMLFFLVLKKLVKLIKHKNFLDSPFSYTIIAFLLFTPWYFLFTPLGQLRFNLALIIAFAWLPANILIPKESMSIEPTA